jgi:thymidylate synthase (FAD)
MTIIEPSVELLTEINGLEVLKKIERAGRTCYKSEDLITDTSCKNFVAMLIKRGHEAMLEHYNITFKIITDRGVTHEIVRHRIASYAQESTRYVNYNKKGLNIIDPCFWKGYNTSIVDVQKYDIWQKHMQACEDAYNKLIALGAKPEEARSVLPNSLKTEIVCTMNLRELRHFLKLRTAKVAHPQMRQVAIILYTLVKDKLPVILDDIIIENNA